MRLQGRIEATLVAGQVAYADGQIVEPPRGRFVRPPAVAAPGEALEASQ
jgi:hypothetical protein